VRRDARSTAGPGPTTGCPAALVGPKVRASIDQNSVLQASKNRMRPNVPTADVPSSRASRSALRRLAVVFVVAFAAAACASPGAERDDRRGGGRPERRAGEGPPEQPLRDFAAQLYPSTYAPLPRHDTLIRGATVLDGTGRRLEATDVLLHDGVVAAIGPGLDAPAGVEIVDAAGRWVTPGIVDPHSHLGNFPTPYTAEDAQHTDVNEDSDPNTAQVWAQHSINVQDPGFSRALAGGVTTLQVMPGSTNLFGGRTVVLRTVPASTVQGMMFPGAPFGLKMACGENVVHAYGDSGRFPVSRMGAVSGQRAAWIAARKYLHDWRRVAAGEEHRPPDPDLKLDTLAGVLTGDVRVHAHCYRADDIAELFGMAREFEFKITAIHHATEAYKIPELFVREGACAAVWSDWWGYKREAYDAIRENAAFLDAAGGCVAMHSDSGIVGQRLNIEAAKAMAAGARAGVRVAPEHAIEWITRNPARMLGLGDKIGSLEPGKVADVVVWSGDPFSIYSHADRVYVDGALAYDRKDSARQPLSDFELGQPSLERRP
jgi:imidazolonepropionase-like amidohydrolase